MEKYGYITDGEKRLIEICIENYWKRNKKASHPCFLEGAKYVLKHLNTINHY